ncbi:GNAT family N-acetyltransferase [Acidovorax sp. sic0104]|uniref:GNAT family N-acetyltransferase n=1 Tax=Acidovorax sp. sic0104 TaxID=2854784 RepID=UPI001C44E7AB|nr:GNAT family protein [Acidovorax sp. sic0104]MBV7542331.1 GNAT family N-acetyltransferase [Acidovorax sp. sic0104]
MPSFVLNDFQQPVGAPQPGWSPRPRPARDTLDGHYCRLEPLNAEHHAADLHAAYTQAPDGRDWTYMGVGPFADEASYRAHCEQAAASNDPLHYAVMDLRTGRAVGTLSLMRIDPAHGVVEVGHVMFSPLLKRTPISTEAQYLLMRYVFADLGYRRYEWKCDSLNAPSREAAARLGFQFEGVFRQAIVYKGRNRDTAWFSVLDSEWPALKAGFERWLAPGNFTGDGSQRLSLAALREGAAQATAD